jgi:E3 ubiquitin-protein ligase RNF14
MSCFQCKTHFCYLCSAWLDSNNPYEHFNKEGQPCYQRLWELEEGDDGNGQVHFDGVRGAEAAAQRAAQAAAELQNQELDRAEREQGQVPPNQPVDIIVNAVELIHIDDDQVLPPAPEPPAVAPAGGAARPVPYRILPDVRRNVQMDGLDRVGHNGGRAALDDANRMGLQHFLRIIQHDDDDE